MSVYSDHGKTVIRFVITHVSDSNRLRTLTLGQQGRFTHATKDDAERRLAALRRPGGLARVLSPTEFQSLAVRMCECWDGHFDPCGIYFDD